MVNRKGRNGAETLDQIDLAVWTNGDSADTSNLPKVVLSRDYEAKAHEVALTATALVDKDDPSAPPPRPQWGNKWEFILSHIGCCIGLGNVWRFPYVCYKNGGGAFFIPYLLCLITTGVPIVFLEVAIGQYFATGGISCWDISPIFRGIGYGTTLVAGWLNVYYIVVLAWGLLYLFYTFYYVNTGLPWASCGHEWNTENCSTSLLGRFNETVINNASDVNRLASAHQTQHGTQVDPTTEFWERKILKISAGINEVGEVQWQLALTLFIMWIICYFCVWKGVKSSGKVVYFTALFPYVMLIILFFRGVTLPNAVDGIIYYLKPDMEKLAEPSVWVGAVTQVFFSYAIALGSLTALGSYNKFDYNCYKHSLALCACDSLTSFFAGFVVFSVLGFMAGELGVDVSTVAEQGPGLAFIVYPKATSQMPLGILWAVLFFLMLLFLGMDSQFVTMEGFFTAIMDIYPRFFRRKHSKELFIGVMCLVWYLLGLLMITRGGVYVFEIFDTYASSGMALLWFAFWECVCVGWIYGADRFYKNIERMIGYRINPWMKYCWKYAGPCFTMFIMVFAIVKNQPLTYNNGKYMYPPWAQAAGWLLALSSIVLIPGYAAYRLFKETGTLKERYIKATTPCVRERPEALELLEKEALLKPGLLRVNGGS